MNAEIFAKIEGYMLSCMGDSAHDREHIYRVLYNALEIAQSEDNVDYDVLIAACLLHDIGRQDQFRDPSLCHAQVGAEKAGKFLVEQGFSVEFAEKVSHCIRTHRFRRAEQPQSVEARILFDADKLDVTGAIGIARTLMYSGTMTLPMYTKRPDGSISDGAEDETISFFQEYKFKLEKLYDKFYTQKGAELARGRQEAAKAFYESIYREVNEGYTQGQRLLAGLMEER